VGGRGFDFRWFLWNFFLTSSFLRHWNPRSAQPRTEMSTRNILWEVKTVGVTTLHLVVLIVWKSRNHKKMKRLERVNVPTATDVPKPEGRGFDY